jgi:hypothetical protein
MVRATQGGGAASLAPTVSLSLAGAGGAVGAGSRAAAGGPGAATQQGQTQGGSLGLAEGSQAPESVRLHRRVFG